MDPPCPHIDCSELWWDIAATVEGTELNRLSPRSSAVESLTKKTAEGRPRGMPKTKNVEIRAPHKRLIISITTIIAVPTTSGVVSAANFSSVSTVIASVSKDGRVPIAVDGSSI
jgi:hypothetical protein